MPKEKTMHELAKEFPDKTYRELEIYRDADRQEEAQQIPLTEAQKNLVDHIQQGQQQEQDDPTLFDIVRANPDLTYRQAEKLKEAQTIKKETGACITAGIKRDKTALEVQKMNKDKK